MSEAEKCVVCSITKTSGAYCQLAECPWRPNPSISPTPQYVSIVIGNKEAKLKMTGLELIQMGERFLQAGIARLRHDAFSS